MAAKDADIETQVTTAAEQLNTNIVTISTTVNSLPTAEDLATKAAATDVIALQAQQTIHSAALIALEQSHFVCTNGYAGVGCSVDATRPEITCPEHTVAIQMPNNESKLNSAHIPRPWVYDTGPGIGGNLTVSLGLYDLDFFDPFDETTVDPLVTWQSTAHPFNFSTAAMDNLELTVELFATRSVLYTVADAAGNTASCVVTVQTMDVDECADGTHVCAVNADCINQGHGAEGASYACECRQGFLGDGWTCAGQILGVSVIGQGDPTKGKLGLGGQINGPQSTPIAVPGVFGVASVSLGAS
jgi:hypothetical protein